MIYVSTCVVNYGTSEWSHTEITIGGSYIGVFIDQIFYIYIYIYYKYFYCNFGKYFIYGYLIKTCYCNFRKYFIPGYIIKTC